MFVRMTVFMRMLVVMVIHIQAARASAKVIAQFASLDRRTGRIRPLALDMVVVAFLHRTDLGLEAQNLFAVFAHTTIHVVRPFENFAHPVCEGRDNFRVVVQIPGLDEIDAGVFHRCLIGEPVNPVDQNAGKQEIREDDDALVSKPCDVIEARFNKREGHTGIADLGPAKAHAFLQQSRDFRDVTVRIGVGRPTADYD